MEQLAIDVTFMLLFVTPLLVLAKLIHAVTTRRVSLARPEKRGKRTELVAWLLLGANASQVSAFFFMSPFYPGEVCAEYQPRAGSGAYVSETSILEYPVDIQCVWPNGQTLDLVVWPFNVVTALFLAASVAVVARPIGQAYIRRRARHRHHSQG